MPPPAAFISLIIVCFSSSFRGRTSCFLDSPAHLIVTLPADARTSRRRIAKEIGKALRVGKTLRQKKNNRIIYVEVESADGAQWFCLEKNGRLNISGCQVRIDTTQTTHCHWEVKEGASPQRSRLPSVPVQQLRNIFNNYKELCVCRDAAASTPVKSRQLEGQERRALESQGREPPRLYGCSRGENHQDPE